MKVIDAILRFYYKKKGAKESKKNNDDHNVLSNNLSYHDYHVRELAEAISAKHNYKIDWKGIISAEKLVDDFNRRIWIIKKIFNHNNQNILTQVRKISNKMIILCAFVVDGILTLKMFDDALSLEFWQHFLMTIMIIFGFMIFVHKIGVSFKRNGKNKWLWLIGLIFILILLIIFRVYAYRYAGGMQATVNEISLNDLILGMIYGIIYIFTCVVGVILNYEEAHGKNEGYMNDLEKEYSERVKDVKYLRKNISKNKIIKNAFALGWSKYSV